MRDAADTIDHPEDGAAGYSVHRRRFLAQSTAWFTIAAGSGLSGVMSRGTQARAAVTAPMRPEGSHFKLSLAAYSFHRVLPKAWTSDTLPADAFTLEDFIDFCAQQQLDGCELTAYYFPKTVTPEYLVSLKQRAHRLGLSISGTAIGNDFCLPTGPARDAQLQMMRDWIDYSAMLGAPCIRIFAGQVPKGDDEAAAIGRCAEAINQSLSYAAEKGIFLALENHGGITATPQQMLRILEQIEPSPWFGINFDSGNFHTNDPYADLEQIAPYAVNAQIKVEITAGGVKQPADLPRIVQILQQARYRGFLTLEYEAEEDPVAAIPRVLSQLRSILNTSTSG
jgi:sugar phosphate isomerase/epimerase